MIRTRFWLWRIFSIPNTQEWAETRIKSLRTGHLWCVTSEASSSVQYTQKNTEWKKLYGGDMVLALIGFCCSNRHTDKRSRTINGGYIFGYNNCWSSKSLKFFTQNKGTYTYRNLTPKSQTSMQRPNSISIPVLGNSTTRDEIPKSNNLDTIVYRHSLELWSILPLEISSLWSNDSMWSGGARLMFIRRIRPIRPIRPIRHSRR
jgi:hypothetical protein